MKYALMLSCIFGASIAKESLVRCGNYNGELTCVQLFDWGNIFQP